LDPSPAGTALSDSALAQLSALLATATAARQAATLAAGELFTDEPLKGIGRETWRTLWIAARDYSVKEAYAGMAFPVLVAEDAAAACVLCQQPLTPDGAARKQRFRKYMDDTLDTEATRAEQAVAIAIAELPELTCLRAARGDATPRMGHY